MQTTQVYIMAILCLLLVNNCLGQSIDSSSLYSKIYAAPDKIFNALGKRGNDFEQNLFSVSAKYLNRLKKKEHKLKRKLFRKDSSAAEAQFGNIEERYATLSDKLNQTSSHTIYEGVYSGHLDSMTTAIAFLQHQVEGAAKFTSNTGVNKVLEQYSQVQNSLNQTSVIEKILVKRQQELKATLLNAGLGRQYKKLQADVYYYRAKMEEYRKLWENPSELEAKILGLAQKIPAFKNFFERYSVLGQLFPMQQAFANAGGATIPGLQDRNSLMNEMINRFGNPQNLTQQVSGGLGSAQSTISQLKDKVTRLGSSGEDMDMPDFKPDQEKTKSFLNRLEVGTNMQNTRGNSFYPITSDLGLSRGYKISDKSIAGIGASYKLGWGKDYRNIRISHEGVGIRSFIDIKLKGSFFASGGLEYNYQQPFEHLRLLEGFEKWQQSGLIGISKIVSLKTKYFKKTRLQLLWDFLSYKQVPGKEAFKFRIGYSF